MIKRQMIVALGVIVKNGQVLMGLRRDEKNRDVHNKWEFPGGGVEFGESIERAITRELKEETGLSVRILNVLPRIYTNIHRFRNVGLHVILIPVLCVPLQSKMKKSNREISELTWMPFSKVKQLDDRALKFTKEIIEDCEGFLRSKPLPHDRH